MRKVKQKLSILYLYYLLIEDVIMKFNVKSILTETETNINNQHAFQTSVLNKLIT